MLDYVVNKTNEYIQSMPKDTRKSYGQFFTSKTTAQFMAGLFCVPCKDEIKILDPGAGSGILSAAVIEHINRYFPSIKAIEMTCYETNNDIIPLLEANMAFLRCSSKIELTTNVVRDNYILSQSDDFSCNLMASLAQKNTIWLSEIPHISNLIRKHRKQFRCRKSVMVRRIFISFSLL